MIEIKYVCDQYEPVNDIIEKRIESIPNLTTEDRELLRYLKLKRTKPVF